MSNKRPEVPQGNLLTDTWKPETHEIVIMFTFDPYAPENEDHLGRGIVCTKCNLIEHECAENFSLEKCLVLGVDVLSSTGAVGGPLAPLFLSMYLGCDGEKPIRAAVAGSEGKYPLALAGLHSTMFRRKPDNEDVERARRDFGLLTDENVAEYLDATVQSEGRVTLPPALLHHIEGCFERTTETSLEKNHRAQQAASGMFVLQKHEYAFCRQKIQQVLSDVRGSFDDATTVLAELSCDQHQDYEKSRNIASIISDQPLHVFVKLIISCC
jgi:hypothetical protein